jgi:hypothetical protein
MNPPSPMTPGSRQTKPPYPTAQQSPPSGGAASSWGAAPSRAMGGSPPSVRVSSFSPTNRGFPPLASCPLARCPSSAHSPAADETKVANDTTYSNSVKKAPLNISTRAMFSSIRVMPLPMGLPPSSFLRPPSLPSMRVLTTTLLRLVLPSHRTI